MRKRVSVERGRLSMCLQLPLVTFFQFLCAIILRLASFCCLCQPLIDLEFLLAAIQGQVESLDTWAAGDSLGARVRVHPHRLSRRHLLLVRCRLPK